ncbi:MAG TPA: hypothetical protein VLG38_02590 [Gammaproteobacteria bacterium]|nr:hypothetical protein [Gammaproteobacteria bacterium]
MTWLHTAEMKLATEQSIIDTQYPNNKNYKFIALVSKYTPTASSQDDTALDYLAIHIDATAKLSHFPNVDERTCGAIMGQLISTLFDYIYNNLPLVSARLRSVTIHADLMHHLPVALNKFSHLHVLNVPGCSLEGALDLRHFTDLQKALFDDNQITMIMFPHNSKLQELNIQENKLRGHLDISGLTHIVEINAQDNVISSVSDLKHNPALKVLDLTETGLRTHPNIDAAQSLEVYHSNYIYNENITIPSVSPLMAKRFRELSYTINNVNVHGLSAAEAVKATIVYLPNIAMEQVGRIRIDSTDLIRGATQPITIAVRTAMLALYGWNCLDRPAVFDEIALGEEDRVFYEQETPNAETFLAGLNGALAVAHDHYVSEFYRELIHMNLQLERTATSANLADNVKDLPTLINDIALKFIKEYYVNKMRAQLEICVQNLTNTLAPFNPAADDVSAHSNEIWDPANLLAAREAMDDIHSNERLRVLYARIDANATRLIQNAKTSNIVNEIFDRLHTEQERSLQQYMYELLKDLDASMEDVTTTAAPPHEVKRLRIMQ